MNDSISRYAAIDAVSKGCQEWRGIFGRCEENLLALPSTQPEIIRCKDCKFYREYGYVNGKHKFLPRCGFNQIYVNGEDFCSRAERREK